MADEDIAISSAEGGSTTTVTRTGFAEPQYTIPPPGQNETILGDANTWEKTLARKAEYIQGLIDGLTPGSYDHRRRTTQKDLIIKILHFTIKERFTCHDFEVGFRKQSGIFKVVKFL